MDKIADLGEWTLVHNRHFNALAEGMSEIKATADGASDQPIADIVAWVLSEITESPSPVQANAAIDTSAIEERIKRLEDELAACKVFEGTLKNHRDELIEENERLKKALEPFAFKSAKIVFEWLDEDNIATVEVAGTGSSRLSFFVRDILAARAALKGEA